MLCLQLCGEFRQRRIGVLLDQPAHVRKRGRVADGPPAARMGPWADVPGRPTPSEELLDKGLTDAKEGSHGALGAEPLITGTANLLSQVKGIGLHAHELNTDDSRIYNQESL
jgi:hypothetical protein